MTAKNPQKKAFLTAFYLTVAIISAASLIYFVVQKLIIQGQTLSDLTSREIWRSVFLLLSSVSFTLAFIQVRETENKPINNK